MPVDPIEVLESRTIAALASLQRLRPAERTKALQQIAVDLLDARRYFFTKENEPDWQGRTHAYRFYIRHVMTEANIPASEMSNLQASLRYHTGNALRERLSTEQLAEIGLNPAGPRARANSARERQLNLARLVAGSEPITSGEDFLALSALLAGTVARIDTAAAARLSEVERAAIAEAMQQVAVAAERIAAATRHRGDAAA